MSSIAIQELLVRPRTAIMGIINTTPDSFSDGGRYLQTERAVAHGLSLIKQGADLLDIGGESTRPGAEPVSTKTELERVVPVIRALAEKTTVPISIDTSKPEVMRAALEAGATMVNDVNGLRAPGAIKVVADAGAGACLMHMLGEPRSMQQNPSYQNVVGEVLSYLQQRIELCVAAGIDKRVLLVDPGIGFGKTLTHNLQLLKAVGEIKDNTECNVLIGVSRKSMIDAILGRSVEERASASVGLAVQAALNGAKMLRVHDVAATYDAVRCVEAVIDQPC